MNSNLLSLFLLAKLASCEIEDATSLTQRPENDGYRSPRFLYVPTALDDYEEEHLEESLTNTQIYENEDVTPKFLDVPTALDDYELYEYSGDYEDFEYKSIEERLANLEKIKSWIDRSSGSDLIPNLHVYSGDYEDFEDESLEEFSANLEENKSRIEQNIYIVFILVLLLIFAPFGLLCICTKSSRAVGDVGAVGVMAPIDWAAVGAAMGAMDPIDLDILMDAMEEHGVGAAIGAMAPIDWAAVGAAMGAMDPIDLDIFMGAMVVGGAEVAVAPPDFSKTVNAMSARGA